MTENYIDTNRLAWNIKTDIHVDSDFYKRKQFVEGKNVLTEIELPLLGDLTGKTVLHLQCHFGLDTLNMARMGAQVTGVDFSDRAIEEANRLSQQTNIKGIFICCDLYSLPQYLNQTFDIVFTSFGTIGWLPDLSKWAQIVAQYLKPGGRFIMADFHPVVWMLNDTFTQIGYDYFNTHSIIESMSGTYAKREANVNYTTISWNHALSETLSALLSNGLIMKSFNEYDFSPYDCFPNLDQVEPNRFRFKHYTTQIPMVYSMEFIKP